MFKVKQVDHVGIRVTDRQRAQQFYEEPAITEGPVVFGHGRRKVCFVRDPDGNVVEFEQILTADLARSRP